MTDQHDQCGCDTIMSFCIMIKTKIAHTDLTYNKMAHANWALVSDKNDTRLYMVLLEHKN